MSLSVHSLIPRLLQNRDEAWATTAWPVARAHECPESLYLLVALRHPSRSDPAILSQVKNLGPKRPQRLRRANSGNVDEIDDLGLTLVGFWGTMKSEAR